MFQQRLKEHQEAMAGLGNLAREVEAVAGLLLGATRAGRTIYICGNGGSAADAQHFAAELIGRFQKERKAWPSVALTTDTSILTALANDYSFDGIFARQIEGLGRADDVLIGLSTSGNSRNVIQAVQKAKELGLTTVGLLGGDGGTLVQQVDHALVVPARVTARIQEAHIFLLHYLAEYIENAMVEV